MINLKRSIASVNSLPELKMFAIFPALSGGIMLRYRLG
jgi:hypothetical protein